MIRHNHRRAAILVNVTAHFSQCCRRAEQGLRGKSSQRDNDARFHQRQLLVQEWLGLTIALDAMARSIGQSDLYPFVLSPNVVEKLDFVHRTIGSYVT